MQDAENMYVQCLIKSCRFCRLQLQRFKLLCAALDLSFWF